MIKRKESRSLHTTLETLEQRIRSIKQNTDNAATWARLIKQYTELEVLDGETLLTLIDKIIVGESEVIGGVRQREVKGVDIFSW